MLSRRNLLIATALPMLIPGPVQIAARDQPTSRLREMLALLPAPEVMPEEVGDELLSYANMGAVMASIGRDSFPVGDETRGEVIDVIVKVPLDSPLYPNANSDWRRMIGFGPQDVTEHLAAYQAPQRIRIYAGDFNPDAIAVALTGQNYVESAEGDLTLFSSPDGDDFNLRAEIDSLAPGAFNYVLLVDDLVVTTNKRAVVDLILETITTGESIESIFEESDLLPVLEPLSGFYLLDGAILKQMAPEEAGMTAEPALPPARFVAGGATLTEDISTAGFMVEFTEPVDDDVAETIETRLDEGISIVSRTPLSELLGPVEVSLLPDSSIVQILGEADEIQIRWLRMIQALDFIFLATG